MSIEEYRNYCLNKKGVTESFPFPKRLPNVLVFKVGDKMFTATDVVTFASISVKCNPDEIDELRATYPSVTTPGYMNKRHWNRIIIDNSISDNLLYEWIDNSYNLVYTKLPKSVRLEFQS